MAFSLTDGLHVEQVDHGFLVLVPGRDEVVQLNGADAAAFSLASDGIDIVPESMESSMAGLIELGIVRSDTWSRRRVLQLGGAAAAAAVVVVALPTVAAAASTSTTTPASTTGSVAVHFDLLDGGAAAASPVKIPVGGDGTAYLYSSADRTSTPVASAIVNLPAGQTFIDYDFTGVAPGTYYVDIQQPFQGYGDTGLVFAGTTYYVDWNFAHATPPSWYTKIPDYQQVTVTAGGTANVSVDIQVRLGTTPLVP